MKPASPLTTTMPTVDLRDRGVVLAYEDSGAPLGSTDYTTVFLVHPFLFDARKTPLLSYIDKINNLYARLTLSPPEALRGACRWEVDGVCISIRRS
ncbi:hypothetical protein BDY19DRAFT_928638 [Irpex rosettiformis]|uniref:Uncharacterized protein n=1 Tax=Irpex rosettiformis TaxID=378272 RepID=A0ACB8UD11_9APHY|nr:hypothetical protein BDY19DRAFT_928638 [Irpex rosettiformis]